MSLPIPFYALVIEEEKRKARNNDRLFWQVHLKTVCGTYKTYMWNAPIDVETNPAFPHVGDIIEVSGFEDQIEDRGSIIISPGGFTKITKEKLPIDYKSIMEFEKASTEEMNHALSALADTSFWEDSKHHAFVSRCLSKFDKEKLLACPAATKIHHSFAGGLIVHTAEVLELCRAIVETSVERYSFINRDVLYASAILHDIGKAETYYINDLGVAQSTGTEKIIGHLFYGMHLAKTVANEMDMNGPFVNEVLHCVASHHGLPEWGSLKPCLSVESGILSRVDYISSRNGVIEKTLMNAAISGQPIQESFNIYGSSYFMSTGMKEYIKDKTLLI